ncbi:MAG TPA: RNA polymerase subunit sigma-70 [Bacteroidales bacterium]|nr:RNA polymerase subunit sigma-70 [Bacteroidales bacterium]
MTLPAGKYSNEELSWFRSIFDQYYENIRSFAYYKTGDVDLADDIVQEVFLKLWTNRSEVKDDTVKSLLYTIASNIIKNHFKHQNVVFNFQKNDQPNETSDETDSNLRQEELNRMLQETLAEIPEKSREVFLMNRIEGLTYADIADRLGLSVKAIEKRMSEALSIIRSRISYKI